MTTYYKFLDESGLSPFAHKAWRLPTNDAPGKWMLKLRGKLIPCVRGYHACKEQDLVKWIAPALYELEYDGEVIEDRDKVLGRKARLVRKVDTWNERTVRLFAADCAERVLHLFEQRYPGDDRPRQAIAAARAFANGEVDAVALAAAKVAACGTVWAVSWIACGDIPWSAAEAAARVTTDFAAHNTEQAWQSQRLLEYLRGEIS